MSFGFGFGFPKLTPLSGGFTPASLFTQGEQGAWYEPSLTNGTLFQDSAGTTAVTAVEQPVGLMLDKSKNGVGTNGPQRYNLLTQTEAFNDAVWTKSNVTITANTAVAPDGTATADSLIEDTSTSQHGTSQIFTGGVANTTYTFTVFLKQNTRTKAQIFVSDNATGDASTIADLAAGTVTAASVSGNWSAPVAAIQPASNGYYRVTLTVTKSAIGNTSVVPIVRLYTTSNFYTGDGTSGLFIWGADLRLASQASLAPIYQPITSSWPATMAGNHAFQTNNTKRPVLSGRVNQLLSTNGFSGAIIAPATGLVVVATGQLDPRGGFTARQIRNTTTTEQHRLFDPTTLTGRNTFSVEVKNVDAGFVQLSMAGSVVPATGATFNLTTGAFTLVGTAFPTASVETLPNGFLRLSITAPATETLTTNVQLYVLEADSSSVNPSTTGTAKSVIVAGADLRVTNTGVGLPPYQRVNTATDYDTAGFPLYLRFDGMDDAMTTNSVDFSAGDKMTVWAGVRKLSDAAAAVLSELTASISANNGAFTLFAPDGAAAPRYLASSKGTVQTSSQATGYSAPITNVATGIGDISGDSVIIRINGTQIASNTADQGAGNYSNAPLFLGARNQTSLYLNGHIYSLIIRGAQSTAEQISATEAWVNQRTAAY